MNTPTESLNRIQELENLIKAWEANGTYSINLGIAAATEKLQKERDEALMGCAELRHIVQALSECIDDSRCSLSDADIQHALSTYRGKGYIHVRELEPIIDALKTMRNRWVSDWLNGLVEEQIKRLEALKGK